MMFECNLCNREFASAMALNGHLRMHGPSKGKLEHVKICCIETREILEVRFFKQHLKKLKSCKFCHKIFKSKYGAKFCSRSCSGRYHNTPATEIYMNDYTKYSSQAAFTFKLGNFSDYFDIELLKEYGMFNSVKNPTGVSRDHILSIKEGFDNQINPKIISHPANCQLIKQNGENGNSSKGSKSHIILDELLQKIEEFNTLYNYKH